jgi:hypothetical protein
MPGAAIISRPSLLIVMERPLGDLPQMLFAFDNVDDVGGGINQFGKVVNSPRGIRFELDMVKSDYRRKRIC